MSMQPHFFSPDQFRKWLEKNHDKETELLIGFYKKGTGKMLMNWVQSVEQALCFGWIDGRTKRIDDETFCIRFTPRKPDSIWSNVNIAHVERLTKLGLMHPAGIKAFEARKPEKSGIYAFEDPNNNGLLEDNVKRFKKNKKAWAWFSKQMPSYKKTAGHWVESAKQLTTKEKRMAQLIESSEKGEYAPPFKWAKQKAKK